MPFARKRKISETSDHSRDAPSEPATRITSAHDAGGGEITPSTVNLEKDILSDKNETVSSDTGVRDQEERRERFRQLQIRAVSRTFMNKGLRL